MNRFVIIVFTGLTLLLRTAFCQNADSLLTRKDSIKVVAFCISKIDTTTSPQINAANVDTNIHYFQNYDPIRKKYVFNANIGNTGQASENMVFETDPSCGFSYGLKSFDAYKFNMSEAKNYYSLLPFTNLFWTLGAKREQMFQVTHYHHVQNKVFMGVDYRIVNAPGRDNFRQKTNDHALSIFTYYATKNKKYGVSINYIFNKIKTQENGGITDDTAYINFRKGDNASPVDIHLKTAENNWRESTVLLKQYVTLSRENAYKRNDSLRPLKTFNLGRVLHTFCFTKQRFKFTDDNPNLSYYPLIPNDTGSLNDSVWFYKMDNTLEWTNSELNKENKNRMLRYFVQLRHAYTEVNQVNGKFYISNLIPSLGLSVVPYKNMKINLSGEYVLLDYNQGDLSLNASAKQHFIFNEKNYGSVQLKFNYSKTKPEWFYEHFSSKYFQWDYDFAKQQTIYTGLNYSYRNLSVGLDYYNLFNYVYMGVDLRPRQYTGGTINVLSAYVYKNFVIGKFQIDNKVVYQYTDKPGLIRKPQLIAMQSYMFTTPMFKKALLFQVGIDLLYNTKYYADSYQPAIGTFVLQNEYKAGNYLNADVFINLKVKRLRAFLKLSNFLSGLIGYNYFTVPHYPMQDRLFRFGISWRFHD
ncbi:MAG TPA: hypothetical protein PKH58_13545 [Paludibacteraceae bacterium]|nr:hypothetical protein [Paludibacteraceae bacterium]